MPEPENTSLTPKIKGTEKPKGLVAEITQIFRRMGGITENFNATMSATPPATGSGNHQIRTAGGESGVEHIVRKTPPLKPRAITQEMVTHETVSEDYHHFPGSRHTVCALTIKNGFTVIGESACTDPASFDADLGRTFAKGKARQKVFEHLAFRARDEITRENKQRALVEEISGEFERKADERRRDAQR